jgi:transposase InsO family protein
MMIRSKAVELYVDGVKTADEISDIYDVSPRTIRRWSTVYRSSGLGGLAPKSTAPKKHGFRTPKQVQQRIILLKKRHPCWGARRIKHQYELPVHWKTAHNIIKQSGLLVRIKAKPQPCKRFQRYHVDSLWQGDTFEFRIKDVGKVYVTGYTDDCSRFRIVSKAYLRKRKEEAVNSLKWALRKGRVPKRIYLDNGKQFIAKVFKAEAKKHGIKLTYGKPHNPRGRGKIERYHRVLYQELISCTTFKSLSHFRRELWKFDQRYNSWRKHEPLGWLTPASIYNNPKYFNKQHKRVIKSGQKYLH